MAAEALEGSHIQLILMWLGIIGAFCTIFSVWYKMDRDANAKIDTISKTFSDQLAKAIESGDQKRARIYERIDEVKTAQKEDLTAFRKEAMENFVPTKICTLMHTNSEKSTAELKVAIQEINIKVDKITMKLYEKNGG